MIADLLVEGKTGAELESALRSWENGIAREIGAGKGAVNQDDEGNFEGGEKRKWGGALPGTMTGDHAQMESVQRRDDPYHFGHSTEVRIDGHDHPASQPRCKTPPDDRFKVPLTAMFKRSLSAPATHLASPSPADLPDHRRQNSIASNFSDVTSDTASSPPSLCSPSTFPSEQFEDHSVAVYNDAMGHLSPLVLPSGLGDSSPARWNDVSSVNLTSMVCANFVSLEAIQSSRSCIAHHNVTGLPLSDIWEQSLRVAGRHEFWELCLPFADASSTYCNEAREYICRP